MLPAKASMTAVVVDGRCGYRFSGRLRLAGLLQGEALETRHAVVAPRGSDRRSIPGRPAAGRALELKAA